MGEDNTNSLNPYLYLAGIVSFGPTKCGTAGYPGKIIIPTYTNCFYPYFSFTFHLLFFSFIFRCIHGND